MLRNLLAGDKPAAVKSESQLIARKVESIPDRWIRDAIRASMEKSATAADASSTSSTGSGAMLANLLKGSGQQGAEKEMKMREWVRLSGNANTRRTYESGNRGFTRYLVEENITFDRLRPCDIADYLRLRYEAGAAASTIAGDRAAIGDGLKNTVAKGMHLDALVKSTLKICMQNAAQSKPKQHVSVELMRALVQLLDAKAEGDWLDHRNVALLLTMMLGMLRESEAVEIRMEDVQVKYIEAAAASSGAGVADSVSLRIRGSKTDQAKKGASVMLAANNDEPSMCPVRRLERYIQARIQAGVVSEYLFSKKDGLAMARSTPCGIVQRMVEQANQAAIREEGIDEKWGSPELYGSHSLRRGGVTAARASGVEMLEIQRHGRWSSMAVWGYVGPTHSQRRQVTANVFGSGVAKKSLSAPNTPVKPTPPQRSPRLSAVKPKRKHVELDEEDVTDAVKEEERVEDYLFMEQMQQGYGNKSVDEAEEKEAPKSRVKGEKNWKPSAKRPKTSAESLTEAETNEAATGGTTPKRGAAKKANEKMHRQR